MAVHDDEVHGGTGSGAGSVLATRVDPLRGRPGPRNRPVHPRAWTRWYLVAADLGAFFAAGSVFGLERTSYLLMLPVTLLAVAAVGLYRPRLTLSLLDDLPLLAGAVIVGCAIGTIIGVVTTRPSIDGASPAVVRQLVQVAGFLVAVVVVRGLTYALLRRTRRVPRWRTRSVVIGTGATAQRLAGALAAHRRYGVDLLGLVDTGTPGATTEQLPVGVLTDYQGLAQAVVDRGVSDVFVAADEGDEAELMRALRSCDRLRCEVFIVPRFHELYGVDRRDVDEVWGVPLVRVRRTPFRSPSWRLKRTMDVTVALGALLVFSPLMALVALTVRLEGGRGVLFRQERVGLDGRPFTVLKFRSLRPADDEESRTRWDISHDHRVGRLGRVLRATSLDELPQLWNVVAGQMSLVGPRPERPHFVEQFTADVPGYVARHRVPVGMTGWAQVHGLRGDTSIADRASFDNNYIQSWTLWMDVKILLRTVGHLLASMVRRGSDVPSDGLDQRGVA